MPGLEMLRASAHPDNEIIIKRERNYKGEALYGFMNGGSELYLEYGFQELRAMDVAYKGEEYEVEIYTMPSPEDAFGIYSLHTFKCLAADTLSGYNCHSRYQLQAVKGNTYISIVFFKPVAGIKQEAVELLNYFAEGIRTENVKIPEELKIKGLPISGRLKYMKGPIARSGVVSSLESSFKDIDCRVWLYETGQNAQEIFITAGNGEDYKLLKSRLRDVILYEEELSLSTQLCTDDDSTSLF
jgi:hypothetical protein